MNPGWTPPGPERTGDIVRTPFTDCVAVQNSPDVFAFGTGFMALSTSLATPEITPSSTRGVPVDAVCHPSATSSICATNLLSGRGGGGCDKAMRFVNWSDSARAP